MVSINHIKPQVDLNINRCMVGIFDCLADDSEMDSTVGKVISNRLKTLSKTQGWLADQIGVSINAVSKWTRSGKISRENAVSVAQILDLSLDQLLGREEVAHEDVVTLERVSEEEAVLLQKFRQSTKLGQGMVLNMLESVPKVSLILPRRINKS